MKKHQVLVSVMNLTAENVAEFIDKRVGIELSTFVKPNNLAKGKLRPLIKQTQQLLQDFPYPITMHGAFYNLNITARDPLIVEVCFQRIRQSLEIAQELGITKVVFHTAYKPMPYKKTYQLLWIAKQVMFWRRIVPIAEKYGITAYLENIQEPDFTLIKGILDEIDSPSLKTCLDTGHTHCFTNTNILPADWVKGYGNQLGYIHLHSNHGKKDEHISFTEGTLNFAGFFEALDDLPSSPNIIIEVKSRAAYLKSYEALTKILNF